MLRAIYLLQWRLQIYRGQTIVIGNSPFAVDVASIPATDDISNTTLEDGVGRSTGNLIDLDQDSCDVPDNAVSCGSKRIPALELEKSEKKPRLIVEM